MELTGEGPTSLPEDSPSASASIQTLDSQIDLSLNESDTDSSDLGDESADDVLGPAVQVHSNVALEVAPGPKDLSQSANDGPKQMYLRNYPSHIIGTAQRRFNYKWFRLYSWLEYSKINDSAYCFCCRHFVMTVRQESEDRRKDQGFIYGGFRAWNRCTGSDNRSNAFLRHMHSEEHRSSAEKYAAYKTMAASGKTVVDLLDSEHKKKVIYGEHGSDRL